MVLSLPLHSVTVMLVGPLAPSEVRFDSLLSACPRLLLRIPLYSFSMVLVDKHGMDKERYVSLVMPVALFNLIDTFPLRKEEMVLQAEMGQTCSTWGLSKSSSLSTWCLKNILDVQIFICNFLKSILLWAFFALQN